MRIDEELMEIWPNEVCDIYTVKRKFFDDKIYEIALSNKRPLDLMSWVRKKSLPAIESISYENHLCNTLHNSYNSAENKLVKTRFLNELPKANSIEWPLFSNQEFKDMITKCLSSSTLRPDHIS